MGVDDGCTVSVAVAVFHQDLVPVLGVPEAIPGHDFVLCDKLLIVEQAGCSPHVRDYVVSCLHAGLAQFVELLANIGGYVVEIIRCLTEIAVDGEQQLLLQHTFDDVFGRAYQVEIFVAALDLGEHDLVDVEYLVDDTDVFAGLLLIPDGELVEYSFVDIVGPVVYLQYLATFLIRACTGREHSQAGGQYTYYFNQSIHSSILLLCSGFFGTLVNHDQEHQYGDKDNGRQRAQFGCKTSLAGIRIDEGGKCFQSFVTNGKDRNGKVVDRKGERQDKAADHSRTYLGQDHFA